ncbi:MAG TPA: T9SS type A sorting domain-containing protein [Puia sp.]|nr:T9SS type A sorting domain-containing protein [Puia sp.]
MKRPFWLTFIGFICFFAAGAQQTRNSLDSAASAIAVSGKELTAESNGSSVFANCSASVKETNKVWLQWKVDSAEEGDYFIIERATEGNLYETIGVLRKEKNSDHYELTDIAPPNGNDFYRIKYTGQGGRLVYSKAMQVSLSGDFDFKFYPNPADKLLIIRTEHVVDLQMLDAAGTVRISKRLSPGMQVINISSLERGVYILRVADKESNRIVSNQLLKN